MNTRSHFNLGRDGGILRVEREHVTGDFVLLKEPDNTVWALAPAGFALFAVVLELVGSAWANSPPRPGPGCRCSTGLPPPESWGLVVAAIFHLGVARAGRNSAQCSLS